MKNITCYGTGVIGTAWGACFLKSGYDVTFYDIDVEKLEDTKKNLDGILKFFISQNLMNKEQYEQILKRAKYTTDVKEAVKYADFIQENCPENIEIKQSALKIMEEFCNSDTIISSSTSGLLVSDIAAKAIHPERVICGHPYNPVYMMPLVEISRSEKTDDACVQAAKEFYKSLGKEPVVLNKECPGFICNRIQIAVAREAYNLVMNGVCSVEDVDKAVVYGVGLRWAVLGPHLVTHLGGGAGGFRALNTHLSSAASVWLKDMAKWTECPLEYNDIAEAGILEEMANREPGTGQTVTELGSYLNSGVMQILRYHKKL